MSEGRCLPLGGDLRNTLPFSEARLPRSRGHAVPLPPGLSVLGIFSKSWRRISVQLVCYMRGLVLGNRPLRENSDKRVARDNPVCWQTGAVPREQPRSPKSLNLEPRSIRNHACRLPSLRKQKSPLFANSQFRRTLLELGWSPPPPLPRLPHQVCGAHLAAFQLEVCSLPQVLADGLKLVV